MEFNDLKNIFYFIIAILWFVFSIFNKDKKNKKQTQKQPKRIPQPNVFEEVLEDFKKALEEEKVLPKAKTVEMKKNHPKLYENKIPDEVLAAQKRKEEREKSIKKTVNEKNEVHENNGTLLDIGTFQHDELQKMVIFTEIFKRPNF
jgi:uncharacterized protein YdiU (UPF0061 family)